jgi:hypothetical protein
LVTAIISFDWHIVGEEQKSVKLSINFKAIAVINIVIGAIFITVNIFGQPTLPEPLAKL